MSQCPCCRTKKAASFEATIFSSNGSPITLYLCKEHDLELFKSGQLRFTEKYQISAKGDTLMDDVMNAGEANNLFADIA